MPNDHEPVKPTPFSAAPVQTQTASAERTAERAPARWLAPAFALLVVTALAVIFWLPGQVAPVDSPAAPEVPAERAPSPPTAGRTTPAEEAAPEPEEKTPYADGLTARDRDEAQAILERVLDAQFALEEKGVERWAAEDYLRAKRLAGEGDEAYRRRDFTAAAGNYQYALEALEAIQSREDEVLGEAIDNTLEALDESEVEAAVNGVEIVELLTPESETAQTLRARVETAPEVAVLRAEAAEHAGQEQLTSALEVLDEALSLDPAHEAMTTERERLEAALLQQNFSAAMSEGYAELAGSNFSAARSAFQRAAAIKPGATETATALTEVATEETAHTLRALAARGQQAEAEERWADAVTHYRKALALDSSVLFASDGLARAEPRARLAQQLELLLAEPERMEDIKVADATAKLLDDARSFGPPDTLLRDQVDRLSELLRKANTPVTVTLRSDAATNVVVHKVARLGTFESHSLALRPGTYTAVGSRRGYRDVRHSFTIEPGASSTAITIRCTEPI